MRSATVDRRFPMHSASRWSCTTRRSRCPLDRHTYLVADDAHVIGDGQDRPGGCLGCGCRCPRGQACGGRRQHGSQSGRRALAAALDTRPGSATSSGGSPRSIRGQGTVTATVGSHMQLRLGTPDQLDLKMKVVTQSLGSTSGRTTARPSSTWMSRPRTPGDQVPFLAQSNPQLEGESINVSPSP